jgi:hypothetical protein
MKAVMAQSRLAGIRPRAGLAAALVVLAALAAPAAAGAAPAPSTGNANFKLRIKVKRGGWKNSRALKLFVRGGARQTRVKRATRTIFPVKSIDFGLSEPVVYLRGGVILQLPNEKGHRTQLSGLRLLLQPKSTLIMGKLHGGRLMPVLRSSRRASFDPNAGTMHLRGSGLQLTAKGRRQIRRRIGIHVESGAAGTGSAGGRAKPALAPAVSLVGGHASWGILNDWRQFILSSQGGGASGETSVSGGAQKFDDFLASGYYTFPFASGTFEDGLYGAADRFVIQTTGAVTFSKEGKSWVFANPLVRFQGATGELLMDVSGTAGVPFATLDIGAVAPTLSPDGKTMSWQGVPAHLTAAGAAAWGRYNAGETLDPLDLAVTFP